jgi:dTDP-4-dehydrorhamnose reductase
MTSDDFAQLFERILRRSQQRITTVGDEQYARIGADGDPTQAWEERTFGEQCEEVREELYDAIVHAAALIAKVDKAEQEWHAAREQEVVRRAEMTTTPSPYAKLFGRR